MKICIKKHENVVFFNQSGSNLIRWHNGLMCLIRSLVVEYWPRTCRSRHSIEIHRDAANIHIFLTLSLDFMFGIIDNYINIRRTIILLCTIIIKSQTKLERR